MITPSRILSWCVYKLSRVRIRMIKNTLIGWFIHWHKIDLGEYQREKKEDYLTFNDFFLQKLNIFFSKNLNTGGRPCVSTQLPIFLGSRVISSYFSGMSRIQNGQAGR